MAIAKKKKRFWDVEIPAINKTTQLYGFSLDELKGRIIKYDLTRMLRGKNIIGEFNVHLKEDKATATPKEIRILSSFMKKMMRKGTDYVEDSFSAECKDAQIKIKPIFVTRRRVSRAVRKAIREKAREELIKYIKTKSAETLFSEILKNQLQKPLSLKLKKIYPLSLCEIRIFKIEKYLEKKETPKKKTKEEKPSEEKKTEETKEEKQ